MEKTVNRPKCLPCGLIQDLENVDVKLMSQVRTHKCHFKDRLKFQFKRIIRALHI